MRSVSPDREIPAYYRAVSRANARLGELNRQFLSSAGSLQTDSNALDVLKRLASSMSPDSLLPETLGVLVRQAAQAVSIAPSRAEPIIGYCLDQDSAEVVLAVVFGDEGPIVRTVRANLAFDAGSSDPPGSSSALEMADVLADAGVLRQWIDPGSYEHCGLVCDGRRIGGLLAPSSGTGGFRDQLEPMKDILGLILAMVRDQSRATLLSEQLAGAGQVLAATQEALAEARTVAAMGEMAAGAGHELNNPLAVISGRAQLMRDRASSSEERKTWSQIADQAHRISDIITDLMDFASPRQAQPVVADVEALTGEIEEQLAARQEPEMSACRIIVEPPNQPLSVLADVEQIRSAVCEVVANAAIAGAPADRSVVRISSEVGESGDKVLISINDNGPGMDAETLASVFTPFFSSQEAGRRVGLGLPRARRYVMNNGGAMWIRTNPGQGTTVFIELPRAD